MTTVTIARGSARDRECAGGGHWRAGRAEWLSPARFTEETVYHLLLHDVVDRFAERRTPTATLA